MVLPELVADGSAQRQVGDIALGLDADAVNALMMICVDQARHAGIDAEQAGTGVAPE